MNAALTNNDKIAFSTSKLLRNYARHDVVVKIINRR